MRAELSLRPTILMSSPYTEKERLDFTMNVKRHSQLFTFCQFSCMKISSCWAVRRRVVQERAVQETVQGKAVQVKAVLGRGHPKLQRLLRPHQPQKPPPRSLRGPQSPRGPEASEAGAAHASCAWIIDVVPVGWMTITRKYPFCRAFHCRKFQQSGDVLYVYLCASRNCVVCFTAILRRLRYRVEDCCCCQKSLLCHPHKSIRTIRAFCARKDSPMKVLSPTPFQNSTSSKCLVQEGQLMGEHLNPYSRGTTGSSILSQLFGLRGGVLVQMSGQSFFGNRNNL